MKLELFSDKTNLTRDELNLISLDGDPDHRYSTFEELDNQTMQILWVKISDSPEGLRAINKIKSYGTTDIAGILRRFCICNFGNLDDIPDLDEDGNLNYEYVDCPLRGKCLDENIICIRDY